MPVIEHSKYYQPDAPSIYLGRQRNRLKVLWDEIEIPFLILLGLFSIVLGTIGFQYYYAGIHEPYNIGRSLYSSLELLDFFNGEVQPPIPWELEVARWLSPAVMLYAVLKGLAAIFRNQMQVLRVKFTFGHIIICGLGQKGLLLAKNFRALGKTVVAIENDSNDPFIPVSRELGVIVMLGDARDELILRKAGVVRAGMLIGVCREDGTNADIAIKARQLVRKRKGNKLNCSIQIKDSHLWSLLRKQEFASGQQRVIRLEIFNIYDHGARQLFNEFPMISDSDRSVLKPPHLLVFGLKDLGEQLVLHASRLWYPFYERSGKKMRITAIDPDAECKIETLCQEYSLIRAVCQWEAYSIELDSPQCRQAEFLYDKHKKIDYSFVYICIENDTVGLSTALSLLEHSRAVDLPILVCLTEDAGLASMLRAIKGMGGTFIDLNVFGVLERTCKPSLLNDGSHESVARAIHAEYVKNERLKGNTVETNHMMVNWGQLKEKNKEDNRVKADQIGVKLDIIGCDIIPWTDVGADRFIFEPDEVELMARLEHERWCKQKIDQGWRYYPIRDDQKKEHPSLIAWDDPRFSESDKAKDRDTVRQIPQYLAIAGFQIYRIPSQLPQER